MYKFLKSLYDNVQIYTHNYLNNIEPSNKYPRKSLKDDEIPNYQHDEKQLRIDTLLLIKQYRNVFFKYTNKQQFNPELYNYYTDDKNFDGGQTAYDDDDTNTKIFDKYILEYIKNRSDLLTHLQCKNKEFTFKTSLDTLQNYKKGDPYLDVVFILDMSEKEVFLYVFSIVKEKQNVSIIKNIMFSVILKHQDEYIRLNLSTFSKNNQNHPYLILDSIL